MLSRNQAIMKIGVCIKLVSGRNRYEGLRAKVGWFGYIEKIDACDNCALVRWEKGGYPEWVSLNLLSLDL